MDSLKKIFFGSRKASSDKAYDSMSKTSREKIKKNDIELNRLTVETPTLQMRYMIDDFEELFGSEARDI